MPIDLEITTVGAAIFGVCMLGSTLAWRLIPTRRHASRMAPKDAVNLAILSTEIAHIRADVTELKKDVKEINATLGRLHSR